MDNKELETDVLAICPGIKTTAPKWKVRTNLNALSLMLGPRLYIIYRDLYKKNAVPKKPKKYTNG